MEKELLEKEEIIEEIQNSDESEAEAVEPIEEAPAEEEITEEVPTEEESPVEEAHVEEELQVAEIPEAETVVEQKDDPFELRKEADRIPVKKSFKEIWNKFSLAILFAAFSIPVAILAYILIVFFLM